MSDDLPNKETAVPSFLQKLVIPLLVAFVTQLSADHVIDALTWGLLAAGCHYLSTQWPRVKRTTRKSWLRSGLERIATSRVVRTAIIAAVFGYVLISASLEIRSLRSDVDTYLMPRTISERQATIVKQGLKKHEKSDVIVKYDLRDLEAAQYASQIYRLLGQAGWSPRIDITSNPVCAPIEGIEVHELSNVLDWNDPSHNPARALQAAFRDADMSDISGWTRSDDNKLYVCIGHRPLKLEDKNTILWKLSRLFEWWNGRGGKRK